jgi:hypothetical protein
MLEHVFTKPVVMASAHPCESGVAEGQVTVKAAEGNAVNIITQSERARLRKTTIFIDNIHAPFVAHLCAYAV